MAVANTGLSLLARGIGEERVHQGHKKLEVSLEPEDYHNIQGRKYYLPPIQQRAWPQDDLESPRELHTHKTFTTRKGPLLLYSEDLALTAKERAENDEKSLVAEDTLNLNTFHDLRSAILSYGAKDSSLQPVYLGFVHNKHTHGSPRKVRPGFSAKRYLSNWSRSWDDSILNTLRNNGHILDKNLFQENALAPKIMRRINDDLSSLPAPYRVTRNMLMAPGSPVVYEFYRIRPYSSDSGRPSDDDYEMERECGATPIMPYNIPGSIAAVVRDEQNKPHAVPYASLARDEQQQVLQRLLLQSAMHKQLLLEAAARTGQDLTSNTSVAGSRPITVDKLGELNMGNAIAALVNTNTSGLLQGQQVFDDKGFKELYKKKFHAPVDPPAPSVRKGLNRSAHRSNIPAIPTLPPIVSSTSTASVKTRERQNTKPDTKLPHITMEPPTPHHPVLSNHTQQSLQSSSWATESVDFRESWPSDETNIWKADIDENELLDKQDTASVNTDKVREEAVIEPSKTEIQQPTIHPETKSKSSVSAKSTAGRKTTSKPGSILSSVSVSLEDLNGPVISGSSKQHSSSDDSVSEAARSIKGREVPGSLRESMRSYKGGQSSNAGSIVLGPYGDIVPIGGSVGSIADMAHSVVNAAESLQVASMVHSTHKGELESLDERDEQEDDSESQDSGHISSEEEEIVKTAMKPIAIPTAHFGDDLPQSKPPSIPSMPLSRMSKSQKSAEESVHSARDIDITGGDFDATRSFANFSYGQGSVIEDDNLTQDGIDDHGRDFGSEDEVASEQEADWPTDIGETGERAEEDAAEVKRDDQSKSAESIQDEVASQKAASQLEELEEQAAAVAAFVLERPKSGRDLAEDAEAAATLWLKKLGDLFNLSGNPDRVRSATVRRRRNSLDASSVASSMEYSQWAGPVVKRLTRERKRPSRKMKRVHSAEAAVNFLKNLGKGGGDGSDGTSEESSKRAESAPSVKSDRSPNVKTPVNASGDGEGQLELGVTNYGVADNAEQEKQAPGVQNAEDKELAKIVQETGLLDKDKGKSTKSSKSIKSNGSRDKNKDEFVVKRPSDEKVEHLLSKPEAKASATKTKKSKKPTPVKKAAPPKKTIKKKSKTESPSDEFKSTQTEPVMSPEKKVEKEEKKETKKDKETGETKLSEKAASPEIAEEDFYEDEDPEEEEKAESPEFIIIHDEFPSDEEPEKPEPLPPSVAQTDMTADSELMSVATEDSSTQGPGSISRTQAKAAKRAAEAEKRKQAVERKRREREEAKRKQQEEMERQEQLRLEFEEEKKRKEEEVRLRKEREAVEFERRQREEKERKKQAAIAAERERKRLEEYKRKMEEIARQKREEAAKKREEILRKQQEDEERQKEEEAKMAAMAEEERLEYEWRKREEELLATQHAEEERLAREAMARLAQEEAELFALELVKQQKEMEQRLLFNRMLQSEENILQHSQEMTPAFTWSYFELLEYLGLTLPDFLKHHNYADTGS